MILILQPELSYRPAPGVSLVNHLRILRLYLWTKANGRCVLCEESIEPDQVQADHIVPQSQGGGNGVDNLQATHRRCNSRKSTLSMSIAVEKIRTSIKGQPILHRAHSTTPRPLPIGWSMTRPPISFLKTRREAKEWAIDDLARESGLRAQSIARIESGLAYPRMSTIRRLAAALNCRPGDLMRPST